MTAATTDWFLTAATLRSAFVEKHRDGVPASLTGSTFWACTNEVGTELKDFIRDLHDEELPNDWRYQTIVQILDAIVEISQYETSPEWLDASATIADQLTSIHTCELAAWLSSNGCRASYHDEAMTEGLISDGCTLHQRLAVAQFGCIRGMADRILQALGLI